MRRPSEGGWGPRLRESRLTNPAVTSSQHLLSQELQTLLSLRARALCGIRFVWRVLCVAFTLCGVHFGMYFTWRTLCVACTLCGVHFVWHVLYVVYDLCGMHVPLSAFTCGEKLPKASVRHGRVIPTGVWTGSSSGLSTGTPVRSPGGSRFQRVFSRWDPEKVQTFWVSPVGPGDVSDAGPQPPAPGLGATPPAGLPSARLAPGPGHPAHNQ